jgi:hypothetical protein
MTFALPYAFSLTSYAVRYVMKRKLISWKEKTGLFIVCLYICITVGDLVIKTGRVVISLNGLMQPHFCACPESGPGFQTLL